MMSHSFTDTTQIHFVFGYFLFFLIRYRNCFIVLLTALSMLVMKHTLTLFLDEILRMIFVK